MEEESQKVRSIMREKRRLVKNKVACLCVCLWGRTRQRAELHGESVAAVVAAAAPGRSLAARATPVCFFLPCLNEAAAPVLPLSALVNLHIDSSLLLYISFN